MSETGGDRTPQFEGIKVIYGVGRQEVIEIPGTYNAGISRPQPAPSFDAQLKTLPRDVRSVAESLTLRDMEGAKRYVAQFLSANRARS